MHVVRIRRRRDRENHEDNLRRVGSSPDLHVGQDENEYGSGAASLIYTLYHAKASDVIAGSLMALIAWEGEGELSAAFQPVAGRDLSSVHLDDLLHDRQTEPAAAAGAIARFVFLIETFE